MKRFVAHLGSASALAQWEATVTRCGDEREGSTRWQPKN
jgi:hypothetical protein